MLLLVLYTAGQTEVHDDFPPEGAGNTRSEIKINCFCWIYRKISWKTSGQD